MPHLNVLDHSSPPDNSRAGMLTAADALAEASSVGVGVKGVYVHVPFCVHRCHYCDFFTIAGRDEQRADYVTRLLDEAATALPQLPAGVRTVFIGGGTPTHLPVDALETLLSGLGSLLKAGGQNIEEWTIEANPDTVTPAVADVLAASGVNRVSIGAQSFHKGSLKALERHHDPSNVTRAMELVRAAGINDVSIDLIFAIPGQPRPLELWQRDLDQALALDPTHLSCYNLSYELGTPLRRRLDTGAIERVSNEIEAQMFEHTLERLAAAGYEHYEVSNWAKPGRQCLHNLLYWRNENWWPLGPSGSGHVNGRRWRNVPRLGPWLQGSGLSPIDSVEQLDIDGQLGEMLMLSLRLNEGAPRRVVEAGFAAPLRGDARRATIDKAMQQGLLAWKADHLVLTPSGLLVADGIIGDLL
jgi:oxygen-independent coproporphyrinogen-3 oxidase